MRIWLYLFLFIYLNSFLRSAAQEIQFEHLSTQNGLSKSWVNDIIQDKMAYMWFATRDGLNKYDGYKFTVYKNNPLDSTSLNSNYVKAVFEDSKGRVWAGTNEESINLFDRYRGYFHRIKYFNDSNFSSSLKETLNIQENSHGQIVIDNHTGIYLLNPDTRAYKKIEPSLLFAGDFQIFRSLVYTEDNIWLFTSKGLILYNLKTKKIIFHNNSPVVEDLKKENIKTVFMDHSSVLWVGTIQGGVFSYNPRTREWNKHVYQNELNNSLTYTILSFVEDKHKNLWIGTENNGIYILDAKRKNILAHVTKDVKNARSLSHNSVYSLYKDPKGTIWVGTFSGGVNYFDKDIRRFKHYSYNPLSLSTVSGNIIRGMCEDDSGSIWISAEISGLNKFDPRKEVFHNFVFDKNNSNTISTNALNYLYKDKGGKIWMGSWKGGLNVLDTRSGKFRSFKNIPGDSSSIGCNSIFAITTDKYDRIWLGTVDSGLYILPKDLSYFTKFDLKPYLKKRKAILNVGTLFTDTNGDIYIGTEGDELLIYNPAKNKMQVLSHDPNNVETLSSTRVTAIYEDKKGFIWVGTERGLNKLNKRTLKVKRYGEEQGLPNYYINGILEDDHGNLWVSTNKGLTKFNPQQETFKKYDVHDGIQDNEFRKGAVVRAKNGEMYFGGVNGFNRFHPDSISDNTFIPQVHITDFLIFNKSVNTLESESPLKTKIDMVKELTIPYYHSVFTFEYAALNYIIPSKNEYAYKMEGFDKAWNYVGNERKATYTNLNPGTYVFTVKASNNDGHWNNKGTSIKIIITPPFWRTWWFKLLGFATVAMAVFSWYKIRMRAITRQKAMLEKQIIERTAEVVAQKEELEAQAEKLVMASEEIKAQSEKVEDLFNEVKDSIRAAQVIQNSILPPEEFIQKYLQDSFVLYLPKDVVSGDFYWFDEVKGKLLIAAVDCTGHGVSGAFMSITGHHLLKQAVAASENLIPAEILDNLNKAVREELHKYNSNNDIQDGMDISLCILDTRSSTLQFAGAICPIYILRNGELIQVKGDRFSIGLTIGRTKTASFTNHNLNLKQGDTIYLFSDGYADQLGGETGTEKYKYPALRSLLMKIHSSPMDMQKKLLETSLKDWRKDVEQIDDVLIMGFRV